MCKHNQHEARSHGRKTRGKNNSFNFLTKNCNVMRSKAKRAVFFTLLILSGWTIIQFTACQKDTGQNPVQHEEDPTQRIEQFYADMQNWKQGVPNKSGQRISLDSAIWYIDATLNYYYANNNSSSAHFHWDTVYVEMELMNDFEAMYQQVFASYDESLMGLSEKYHAISGENKRFIMAMINDYGSLPNAKRQLQIVTVTGTGSIQNTGDFGENENFRYEDFVEDDCFGNTINTNAPEIFEAALYQYFNPAPGSNCRWSYYGSTFSLSINYEDNQLNYPLTNYLDYKVFAASEAVAPFDGNTECLEYDYNGSGIHEMQFYFDHKVGFVGDWLNSSQNIGNKKLAIARIKSREKFYEHDKNIYHEPTFFFRKRILSCTAIELPPIY